MTAHNDHRARRLNRCPRCPERVEPEIPSELPAVNGRGAFPVAEHVVALSQVLEITLAAVPDAVGAHLNIELHHLELC